MLISSTGAVKMWSCRCLMLLAVMDKQEPAFAKLVAEALCNAKPQRTREAQPIVPACAGICHIIVVRSCDLNRLAALDSIRNQKC